MARKRPLSYEEFKTIYSKVPRLCVEVVIITDKGVLLTLRKNDGYIGQWHLPGGTVFYRESLEDALKRVAEEELGIEVKIEKFLGHIEYLSEVENRGFGYSVGAAFLCSTTATEFNSEEEAKFWKSVPDNSIVEQKEFLKGRV